MGLRLLEEFLEVTGGEHILFMPELRAA
jgi:hypothetical protein